jgi:transposase-like protein
MASGKKSDAKRQAVALALAAGETIKEAAAGAGVGERTVGNWLGEADFAALVDSLRAQILERTMSRMIDTTTRATERLRRLVRSRKESIALGACRTVLEQAVRLREAVTLAERVAALEQAEQARKRRQRHE